MCIGVRVAAADGASAESLIEALVAKDRQLDIARNYIAQLEARIAQLEAEEKED